MCGLGRLPSTAEMSSEEKPSKGLSSKITEGSQHVSARFLGFRSFLLSVCCLCADVSLIRFLAFEMWSGDFE